MIIILARKKYNLIGLFLLGFFAFNLALGLASATSNSLTIVPQVSGDDSDDDGIDDEFEHLNERSVKIKTGTNKTIITSTQENANVENEMELEISYGSNGISIKLEFNSELEVTAGNSSIEVELELEFQIVFSKIIEYVDKNGDNVYNSSIDELIQVVPLDSWKLVHYLNLTVGNGSKVHVLRLATLNNMFQLSFYVVEQFEKINNTIVAPTEVKFDIKIINFKYLNSSSQLALHAKLESESEYENEEHTPDEEHEYASEEEGVFTTSSKGYTGFFTWTKTALIDGVEKNVTVSQVSKEEGDPNSQKIYINYPRGTIIIHDPKVGIANTLILTTESLFPLVLIFTIIGVVSSAIIVFTVLYMKKRPR